jgi:DNA-binding CsgD family transcriptional regulator
MRGVKAEKRDEEKIRKLAAQGLSDLRISEKIGMSEGGVRSVRHRLRIPPLAKQQVEIDWSKVDFSKTDKETAGEMGVHPSTVATQRRAQGVTKAGRVSLDGPGHGQTAKMEVRVPAELRAAASESLKEKETLSDFVRAAMQREIQRRSKAASRSR